MSRTGSPVRRNISGTRTDTKSGELLREYSSQSQGHHRRDIAREPIIEPSPTTNPIYSLEIVGPSSRTYYPSSGGYSNAPHTPPFIMDEKGIKEYLRKLRL